MRTDVQTYGILIASGDSPPIAVTPFASREPSDWHFFAYFYAKLAEYVQFYACVIILAPVAVLRKPRRDRVRIDSA
jgi:hypothetical protein